jgi:hypothetical protein
LDWALGGATVYLRALASHLLDWFKLSVGQRSGEALPPFTGAPGPKRSRLFAVVVLACAAALLCIPEGREAVRTLRAVWQDVSGGFMAADPPQTVLQRFAIRAQKAKDAHMMAFAALSMRDGHQRTALANLAVALDPQLVWIYTAMGRLPDEPFRADWLAKAEAGDPGNAVPYLMAADAVAALAERQQDNEHSPTDSEIRDSLTSNPQWLALMNKAFRTPRYDSYYPLHRELNREIWRRDPELPFTAAFQGLWMHSIPSLYHLRIFATFLIQQSEKERIAGHMEKAQQLLQEVDAFGSRMRQPGPTDIERLIGAALQKDATQGWKAFYEATGRTAQAQAAAQHLSLIDENVRKDTAERRRIWRQRERGTADAWLLQLGAFVMLLAVILAIVSIGLFELHPAIWKREAIKRRFLACVADFAPATALVACAGFLLAFLPYARLFAAFRAGDPTALDEQQLMTSFWILKSVPWIIVGSPGFAVVRWTLLTILLSAVAAVLLARMAYRATRRTAPQA